MLLAKILLIVSTLNLQISPDWKFEIADHSHWMQYEKTYKLSTYRVFTFPQERRMVFNEDWLSRAKDREIREVVSHEFGHIVCKCNVEKFANIEGTKIYQPREKNPPKEEVK